MKLRFYNEDDFVNAVPCIYKYRDRIETVFPISISGRNKFDGGRLLTFMTCGNGTRQRLTREIGGSNLTQVLYAPA